MYIKLTLTLVYYVRIRARLLMHLNVLEGIQIPEVWICVPLSSWETGTLIMRVVIAVEMITS